MTLLYNLVFWKKKNISKNSSKKGGNLFIIHSVYTCEIQKLMISVCLLSCNMTTSLAKIRSVIISATITIETGSPNNQDNEK